MSERLSDLGYGALGKETTFGTAVTPSIFFPLYSDTMQTDIKLDTDKVIAGVPYANYAVYQGQREHMGALTVMGEPNTAALWFNMLLNKAATLNTYTFTIASASASAGATYTNNGVTFTVTSAVSSSTTLVAQGTGAPSASGTLTYVSGTPTGNITFSAFTAGTTSYQHNFAMPGSSDSASYTLDILKGLHVIRYFGVKASGIKPSFNKNKMELAVSVSAIGSFSPRAISITPTGSNPYTITFSTAYDPNPTTGLVVGDTLQIYSVSGNSYTKFTVASIPSGTTITTTTNVTANAAGDIVSIAPQTPSYSLLSPFEWSSTQFCFGSTAATALVATQTQVEDGSGYEVKWEFNSAGGEHRSGTIDPASLPRKEADVSLNIKKFFDSPTDMATFKSVTASGALVIRSYSGSYELRLTLNKIYASTKLDPESKVNELLYIDATYVPVLSQSDSQAFDVKVINTLATV
jgi:hypothetical protein